MAISDHQPPEFAPLGRIVNEPKEIASQNHTDGDLEKGNEIVGHAGDRHRLARTVCWSLCSSTAIYTTKRLMTKHRFHYPLHISLLIFVALSLVYILALRLSSESASENANAENPLRPGFRTPDVGDMMLRKHGMLPAALAGAASVPLILEGILHMPSLPVLVMLFPLIYATESLVLSLCFSASRPRKRHVEEILVVVAAIATLYNEYRLTVPGLLFGLLGILLVGITRGLYTIGLEHAGPEIATQARLNAKHGFVISTLAFGVAINSILSYCFEHLESSYTVSHDTVASMTFNILSLIGTFWTGSGFLAYSPVSFQDPESSFSTLPLPAIEFLASFLSSLFVSLFTLVSSPVVVVSWIQVTAYLFSSACLIGMEAVHSNVLQITGILKQKVPPKRTPSILFSALSLIILIAVSSFALSFLAAPLLPYTFQEMPSTLDISYAPTSRFDIVVSMYDENPEHLQATLDAIKSTRMLRTIQPNIIIYTKNPDADLFELKKATGANIVKKVANFGREGGTYLHHIVNNWDGLAEQTMFIQAHVHNKRELIPRINDYLIPETGMLSLGFTGVTCDCKVCGDRWGWVDEYRVVPRLYQQVHNETCKPDTPILLSYKGQFVASAKRIRGIDREIYQGLAMALHSHQGWSENRTVVGDRPDRPDNPYFGFTVERIWGLLMQCATNGRVATRCPSLLSGMGRGGDPGDCQCLDR